MVRIHAAALPWAWAQISSGVNICASAASDTRALLPLQCTHQHDASRTSLAHMLMPAIHPPSGKVNSANFATDKCICDIMSRSEHRRLPPREEVVPDERCGRTCQEGTPSSADRAPQRNGEAPRATEPGQERSDERGGASSRDREAEDAERCPARWVFVLASRSLFTGVPRRVVLRTSPVRSSRKFAGNL